MKLLPLSSLEVLQVSWLSDDIYPAKFHKPLEHQFQASSFRDSDCQFEYPLPTEWIEYTLMIAYGYVIFLFSRVTRI